MVKKFIYYKRIMKLEINIPRSKFYLPWVNANIIYMFRLNNLRARDDNEDIKRGAH